MSKLRHLRKCYVQDIGRFSVPEGHRIIQPYISKWFTASIWTQDLIYYYVLYGLHFLNIQRQLEGSYKVGSVCTSVHPSVWALELYEQFFLNFDMVLETCMKFCVAEPDFLGKIFLPQKLGKWNKNGPKTGFFEFIEKFRLLIFPECVLQ